MRLGEARARSWRTAATRLACAWAALAAAACGDDGAGANNATQDVAAAGNDAQLATDTAVEDVAVSDSAQQVDAKAGDNFIDDDNFGVGADSKDVGQMCPGAPGCACAKNADCDSAQCIQVPEGNQCAKPCTSDCPAGFSCKLVGASDPQSYCLPNYLSLCAPCKQNSDCSTTGIEALCVDYGGLGSYCGSPCAANPDCPDGYECADVKAAGKAAKQCKLKNVVTNGSGADCTASQCTNGETCVSGKCQVVSQGQCGCSKWAVQYGHSTDCSVTNEFGTCKSERKCETGGLGACGAKAPAAEQCNLKDDNCDGITDNLAADFVCYKTAFLGGGSGKSCKGDADCTTPGEACDSNGVCHPLIGKCAGKPTCAANGSLICNDSKTPKLEQCNGEDDDCDGDIDEDFTWPIPGGGEAAIGKACGFGPCGGGKVICKSLNEAACTTDAKASKEICDGIDNDCDGKTDNAACEDNNKCTDDVCDSAANKCSNKPAVDCNDGNQCTLDSCAPATGACGHENLTGSCDDGDLCTVGDACKMGPVGLPQCTTGTQAQNCDDANPCTDDGCAAATGCSHLPNAVTQTCYSGPAKTLGVGTCSGGTKYCKDGLLGTVCVNEVLPNKTESCDGKDDTCNGATDENCSATTVQLQFAAASFDSAPAGGGTKVTGSLGGSSPTGAAPNSNGTGAWLGFIAWVAGLFK